MLDKERKDYLLRLFSDFVTTIGGPRHRTSNWKIKKATHPKYEDREVYTVSCYAGSSNYITVPISTGIMAFMNATYKDVHFKEIERFCIEDDDTYTRAYWQIEIIQNDKGKDDL